MEAWNDQIVHFEAIPWCAKLLSDPNLIIRPPVTRLSDPKSRAFEFTAITLNSASTVPYFIAFWQKPTAQIEAAHGATRQVVDGKPLYSRFVTKSYSLLKLGHGLTSVQEGVCHGGMVAVILDECTGAVGMINKIHGLMDPVGYVTQTLEVKYLRPVPTGSTVLVTCTLVKVEGSKRFWVEAEMTNEDGKALAKAEAVYAVLKTPMDLDPLRRRVKL